MACFLLALILATTVLTVPTGDNKLLLANAAPASPAEAFWRTALPGFHMPETIRELLHAPSDAEATTVLNDVKFKDDGPPPMNFNYDDYRAPSRQNEAVDAPSSGVQKLDAKAQMNAATDGTGSAGATTATIFFLEDAVRVGGTIPLRSVLRAATDSPAEGLAPPRLYTVRDVRAVAEGSTFVVCRREAVGGPDHDAAVAYGCRATTTSGPARAYAVDVAGGGHGDGDGDGDAEVMTAAVVVCHTDTSLWDTGHVAFRLLGVNPGGAAVCHALPGAQVLAAENHDTSVSP